jgi:hypothetical protein
MRLCVLCVVFAAVSGCSGTIIIDGRDTRIPCSRGCPAPMVCEEGYCVSTLPCSLANKTSEESGTAHYCPKGLSCDQGLCRTPEAPSYCACSESESCVEGACVPATDNQCSMIRPKGLCPAQYVCRDGQCVRPPDEDSCSTTNPRGYCPPGFACTSGYCTPTVLEPCGTSNPSGLCEWGFECSAPGPSCVPIKTACSADNPQGVCKVGEVCTRGECQCVACNSVNIHGCCPNQSVCSAAGICIPQGTCAKGDDCNSGDHCSCATHAPARCADDALCAMCILEDTCRCNEDCDTGMHCDLTTGLCERNLACVHDNDCLQDECCSTENKCITCGTCKVSWDCRGDTPKCCGAGRCVAEDGCCAQEDCDSGYRCSNGFCLLPTDCRVPADCAPGHTCLAGKCAPDPASACTAQRVTGVERELQCDAEDASSPSCCPTGVLCCQPSWRCSTPSPYEPFTGTVCVPRGRCFADQDCLTPAFACDKTQFRCQPVAPCATPCPGGTYCSNAGACIPLANCAVSADCPEDQLCNGTFVCERAVGCGQTQFATKRVKPNVLIVLDRSSSMQICQGSELQDGGGCCGTPDDDVACTLCTSGDGSCFSCTAATLQCSIASRWQQAVNAADRITQAYSDVIRFGLATYPTRWCGGGPCKLGCNYCSCDLDYCTDGAGACVAVRADAAECHPNYEPGHVDVSVDDNRRDDILAYLAHTFPGGGTPAGPTLRRIAKNPLQAGVAAEDRQNFLVLVTDGAANGDVDQVTGCRNTDYACKVNKALDSLRLLAQSVSAYVVGFAFGSGDPQLNCHADHGGQSTCALPITCGRLTDADACTGKGCVWDDGARSCQAPPCTTFAGDKNACEAAGCTWSSSTCTDTPTCSKAKNTCYYEAEDADTLVSEFRKIVGEVASCSYALNVAPSDPARLFAYLLHDGIEERLERDPLHQEGWDYLPIPPAGQAAFFGNACSRIKSGTVAPLVAYGCSTGE